MVMHEMYHTVNSTIYAAIAARDILKTCKEKCGAENVVRILTSIVRGR